MGDSFNPQEQALNIKDLQKDQSYMKDKIDKIEDDIEKISKLIESSFKELDNRFSGKWVEKIIVWGGSIIGASLLILLFEMVRVGYLRLFK